MPSGINLGRGVVAGGIGGEGRGVGEGGRGGEGVWWVAALGSGRGFGVPRAEGHLVGRAGQSKASGGVRGRDFTGGRGAEKMYKRSRRSYNLGASPSGAVEVPGETFMCRL